MSNIYSFYIYAYLREDGTPFYIGKGKGNRAWNKKSHRNGFPKNVNRIVIMEDNLTEIGALALERFYIRWYGRKDDGSGILNNRTDGGDGVCCKKGPMSDDHKRKISETNKNRTFSVEHRKKLSEAKKGKTISEEHRKKISEANYRRWNRFASES